MIDRVVETGPVPIATRDYGGTGSPVLLLHGAGGNLTSWDVVGPLLSASHRTVAVDLRGHGESGDGPWNWDAVVTDLEAVATELHIERPAMAGHSLGGGLGAWWALRHPECPAVVDLDGHRSPATDPAHYDAQAAGLTDEELHEHIRTLNAQFDAMGEAMAAPLTDDQVDDMLTAHSAMATSYGIDPDRWAAGIRRGLVRRDGATFMRPGREVTRAIRRDTRSDSLPVFAELTSPFLLVLATNSLPQVPPDLEPLMVAFRSRLRRDLDLLIASRPNLRLHEIDASHAVLFEQPREVTEIIATFIADAGSG